MIFSYAATFELNQVPYAVYNQDAGVASRELLASFQGSPRLPAHGQTLDHLGQVAPAIDAREVLMVINIPPDFTRQLHAGASPATCR